MASNYTPGKSSIKEFTETFELPASFMFLNSNG